MNDLNLSYISSSLAEIAHVLGYLMHIESRLEDLNDNTKDLISAVDHLTDIIGETK